jgi:hypothetical protein
MEAMFTRNRWSSRILVHRDDAAVGSSVDFALRMKPPTEVDIELLMSRRVHNQHQYRAVSLLARHTAVDRPWSVTMSGGGRREQRASQVDSTSTPLTRPMATRSHHQRVTSDGAMAQHN